MREITFDDFDWRADHFVPHLPQEMKLPSDERPIDSVVWQKGHEGKYCATLLSSKEPGRLLVIVRNSSRLEDEDKLTPGC